jgi:histidinol-phosphate aminotransferase
MEELMNKYYVNQYIRDYTMKDYAKGETPSDVILDCSLGVNPEDLPPKVLTTLQNINPDTIKHYPHDETVLEAIAKYYRNKNKSLSWLTKDYIFMGDGTTDILYNLNMLCLTYGKRVLGHVPQFTAYIDQVNCLGAHYEYYPMYKGNNYKFEIADYLNRMATNHDLFIVENPNNPTGQILELSDIESIAKKAATDTNKILIVDEAYGDYMPIERSAINLVPAYPNVVVTRTFSKGFGMAGIRLGYVITSNEKISDSLEQIKKVENQFNANGIARELAKTFLGLNPPIPDMLQVSDDKAKVLKILNKLKVAATAPTTPIMTLYYDISGTGLDLQKFLYDNEKLWTVNCASYGMEGLQNNVVRLMLPKTKDVGVLVDMLVHAQSLL